MEQMTKQIDVVGAVIVRENKVLAARRAAGMSLPLTWEFPGGKVEAGEAPKEALLREVEEELSCIVDVGSRVETTTHEYDFGVVKLTTFYATLVEGEPTLTEHQELRWIHATQLDSVEWAPADLPTVERVIADFSEARGSVALQTGSPRRP